MDVVSDPKYEIWTLSNHYFRSECLLEGLQSAMFSVPITTTKKANVLMLLFLEIKFRKEHPPNPMCLETLRI